jgi:catechol 1,2-dioxygenase
VLGPFHRPGAPKRAVIAGPKEPGKRLAIQGQVLHHDCKTPVVGALLDIWHADAEGRYDNDSANYRLRAQVTTDAKGRYAFETIQPGHYPLGNSMRPAHIHFTVSYPGCHPLTTQLYFKGDRYLKPNDPCGICNSGDATLIVGLTPSGSGAKAVLSGTFDIALAKA